MSDDRVFEMRPIGIIHTPFTELEGMPIQPASARGVAGSVEVFAEYATGLLDLEGFSHAILVYALHRSRGYEVVVTPFLDSEPHGVFATRAPRRPNQIGISVVRVVRIEGSTLHIENIDVLDGTPLLDIKPHVPRFEAAEDVRMGWLESADTSPEEHRADERFLER